MLVLNPLNLCSELILKVFPLLLAAPLGFIGGLFQFLTLARQFLVLGLQLIQAALYSLDVQFELLLDSNVLPYFTFQSLY